MKLVFVLIFSACSATTPPDDDGDHPGDGDLPGGGLPGGRPAIGGCPVLPVEAGDFEAVDLTPITSRPGSAAVPAP